VLAALLLSLFNENVVEEEEVELMFKRARFLGKFYTDSASFLALHSGHSIKYF